MPEILRIRIIDKARRRDGWGGFPDPSSNAVAAGRKTFPEDSRFAESPIANPDDVLARIKAAGGVAVLRQVLSELETARKEDAIEIARRYTGRKAVSTKKAIDDIWTTWYTRRGTADAEWKEEKHPRSAAGKFAKSAGGGKVKKVDLMAEAKSLGIEVTTKTTVAQLLSALGEAKDDISGRVYGHNRKVQGGGNGYPRGRSY